MGGQEAESDLARTIAEQNPSYLMVSVLDDGSIAVLHDLLFTRAILLGVTSWGFERRFCFEDRALATQRFFELKSEDDEPEGYVARRTR